MGCSPSSFEENAAAITKKIEEGLKIDHEISKKVVKILLLGNEGSGKTTLLQQMQLIHGKGYSLDEHKNCVSLVHAIALGGLFSILKAMPKLKIDFESSSAVIDYKLLCKMTGHSCKRKITSDLGCIMMRIWGDEGVQDCFSRSMEYQLCDYAGHFLNDLNVIKELDYLPTKTDFLKAQRHTRGIQQIQFSYRSSLFEVYDFGGNRSERKKWSHCFE